MTQRQINIGSFVVFAVIIGALVVAAAPWQDAVQGDVEMAITWDDPQGGDMVADEDPDTPYPQFTVSIVGMEDVQSGDELSIEADGYGTIGSVTLSAGQSSADVYCSYSADPGESNSVTAAHHDSIGVVVEAAIITIYFSPYNVTLPSPWETDTNHRWSKYGPDHGAGYDNDAGEAFTSANETVTAEGVTVANSPGYSIEVYVEGHLLDEISPDSAPQVDETWTTSLQVLAYAESTDDDWYTWLNGAGTKTITVKLIRNSDSAVIAENEYFYIQFNPSVSISSPSGSTPGVFDLVFSVDEWYLPTEYDFALYIEGEDAPTELEETSVHDMLDGVDPTGSITLEDVDVERPPLPAATVASWMYVELWTDDSGAYTLRVATAGDEPLVEGTTNPTYSPQYEITITSPDDGTSVDSSLRLYWHIDNGWPQIHDIESFPYLQLITYEKLALHLRYDGIWVETSTYLWPGYHDTYTTEDRWLEYGRGQNNDIWLGEYDGAYPDAVRVVWEDSTGSERTTDTIEVAIADDSEPEPPTPPPPDEDDGDGEDGDAAEPSVEITLPPNSATVQAEFSLHANYEGFTAGNADVTVTAAGAENHTIYSGTKSISSSGQLVLSCAFPDGASEGNYTLILVVSQSSAGEQASDSISATYSATEPTDDDPPAVEITSPDSGASVSGDAYIVAEATDDVAIWAVVLWVDGVKADTLYEPNHSGDYRFTLNTTAYANGEHTIMVRAWDSALQTATDGITTNIVNAQADLERVLFTKQLGTDSDGAPINDASKNFRPRAGKRAIEVIDWPDEDELPTDPRLRYNVYVGYHCPGDSADFDDYTLVTPGVSHQVSGRTIKWGLKAVPQRTEAYWEIECDEISRLAVASNGDPLLLCDTPHDVQRFSVQNDELSSIASLASLTSAPADMAAMGGKVFLAAGDMVLVLDEDTGDLDMQITLPWPDEIDSITALATDGETLYMAADLTAGGSRVYTFTWDSPQALADCDDSITALAVISGTLFVGTDAGEILTGNDLSLTHSTGEAQVVSFGANAGARYAGTGDSGTLYYRVGSWGPSVDFGWDTLEALEVFGGYAYAGGRGSGGEYLWYEQGPGAQWVQTIALDAVNGVADMLNVADSDGHEQLFVATVGVSGTSRLYRIEKASASDHVCGVNPPNFCMKILKD